MFNVKKPDSFNVQCFMISKHRFTLQTKLNIHVVHELKPQTQQFSKYINVAGSNAVYLS